MELRHLPVAIADFPPGGLCYAAARPVEAQSAGNFVERMKGLAGKKIRSRVEAVLGSNL